jgi:hypothetical protein
MLRPAEEALMCSECDRPQRRSKRWKRLAAKLLISPTLLRLTLVAAPYVYRLGRWVERNILNDS